MNPTRDHDVYDRATDTWTHKDPAPASIVAEEYGARFGAALGQDVFVMLLDDVYTGASMKKYSQQSDAWTTHSNDWAKGQTHRIQGILGARDRLVSLEELISITLNYRDYNVVTYTWSQRLSTSHPYETGAICHLMGNVYLSGGAGYSFRKHYEYNPNTFVCTEKADPPYIVRTADPIYPYGYIQISQVGDDFCAGTQGGVIVASTFYYSDYFLCVYDPKTDTWASQARVWPEGHWYQGAFCDGAIS